MLALLAARDANFLLLDEPINHLDIPSRDKFEQAPAAFPGTVRTVVHDRCFIERTASEIRRAEGEASAGRRSIRWSMSNGRIDRPSTIDRRPWPVVVRADRRVY
jgi:ATPase subunit of ABC transporter with duplicated ATPase domains